MDVLMPQLGETVSEGKVSAWFKAQGESVAAGENLFEIETDKVTMEVQALSDGVLSEIRVAIGEVAPVGAVVAVIGDGSETSAAPQPAEPTSFAIAPFAETNTPSRNFGKARAPNGVKVTPLARRLIAQNGIDLAGLADTARAKGLSRIGRAEVEQALAEGPATTAFADVTARSAPGPQEAAAAELRGGDSHIPFNTIRQQTGARLTESWQSVPHVFQAMEVDFAAIESVRQAHKATFRSRHGVALTYMPFIARAVCIAIAEFPRINAELEGDGLRLNPDINLGVAVDLSHEGLVVPVLRNTAELTATGLAKAMARLADKAREKALGPDDFAGGTYTISNNGSFGTVFTAPIINPPQVAILSTDAVRKRPVVVESEAGDAIAIHPVGMVGQSFDHRAFDGAYSAAYLQRLKEVLETHDWATELG